MFTIGRSSTYSPFTQLPDELVQEILVHCQQSELFSLIRGSRRLYKITLPLLYKHVDLLIRPHKLPRIDTFYLTISKDTELARKVRTLQLGLSSERDVKDGQHELPQPANDTKSSTKVFDEQVEKLFEIHPWLERHTNLRDAVTWRLYDAFAALVVITLPTLCRLELSDHERQTLALLYKVLYLITHHANLIKSRGASLLLEQLSTIEEIVHNVDTNTGVQHSIRRGRLEFCSFYRLKGLRKVELCVPSFEAGSVFRPPIHRTPRWQPDLTSSHVLTTNITSLILRHTSCHHKCLRPILSVTPQLKSLVVDISRDWYADEGDRTRAWLIMRLIGTDLALVKNTLEILVFSVECFDSTKEYLSQHRTYDGFLGRLNLSDFALIHTLECPLPFITGDPDFSIVALKSIFPELLPPNLRHLSIRTDMSRAQLVYPFKKPTETTLEATRDEENRIRGARMDLSYTYQATLLILDSVRGLESISVWQPVHPEITWHDGLLRDVETTCRNKGLMAKIVYPQIFRLRDQTAWDLVKEVTLFDPATPDRGHSEELLRGERALGVPLGLAMQYHLDRFLNDQVEV